MGLTYFLELLLCSIHQLKTKSTPQHMCALQTGVGSSSSRKLPSARPTFMSQQFKPYGPDWMPMAQQQHPLTSSTATVHSCFHAVLAATRLSAASRMLASAISPDIVCLCQQNIGICLIVANLATAGAIRA